MPWAFEQSTGTLYTPAGTPFAIGYAGAQPHVNDPSAQDIPNVGPIPAGDWAIGAPVDNPESTGPFSLPLTPIPPTQDYGRSGFFVHGDSIQYAGLQRGSDGCIVLPLWARKAIWNSADHSLSVVASLS